jgi:HEPN domain-containing protein
MIDREQLAGLYLPRFSWDYDGCSDSDRWLQMAFAYQECSCHLFAGMIEHKLKGTYHHAKVAASLFEHAVELFLKGGIALAGKVVPNHHFLDQLYGQFKNLYPGKKFQFVGSIAEMVAPSALTPHNEFARYPSDQSGKPWQGHPHFDLATWFDQASRFLEDFRRLEPLMKTRYPQVVGDDKQ